MPARSSQEASHVRRRTRCSSKVCRYRRRRQDGPGGAGDDRLHERARAAARSARALSAARGGRGDLPLLALALRPVSAGRDRLPPGPCQAAARDRGRPAEKRCGGRAAPRPDAPLGLIPEAYPRPADQRDLLRLLRHRTAVVRFRTRLVCRIHSQLHQQRLSLPREQLRRRATRAWLQETAWPRLTVEQRAIVTTHLELIDHCTPLIRALERRIAAAATGHATAPLLATIPGLGPYRSLLLAAELSPITRFPRAEHLVSYAGLAPVTRSSGGHTYHGSIPQGANRWVRGALVSAIPSHVRYAPTSPLTVAYAQLKARLGWRVARVATARKLARVVFVMLTRRTPWRGAPAARDVRDEVQNSQVAPTTSFC